MDLAQIYREAMCAGKQAFDNVTLAMRIAARSRKRKHGQRRPPHAYRCDICRKWHIGGSMRQKGDR